MSISPTDTPDVHKVVCNHGDLNRFYFQPTPETMRALSDLVAASLEVLAHEMRSCEAVKEHRKRVGLLGRQGHWIALAPDGVWRLRGALAALFDRYEAEGGEPIGPLEDLLREIAGTEP